MNTWSDAPAPRPPALLESTSWSTTLLLLILLLVLAGALGAGVAG